MKRRRRGEVKVVARLKRLLGKQIEVTTHTEGRDTTRRLL